MEKTSYSFDTLCSYNGDCFGANQMTNQVTQTKILIEAKDNTGKLRKLSMKDWSAITGKSYGSMSGAYHKRKTGKRDLTNREIVGLDHVDYVGRDKQKAARKKVIQTELEAMTSKLHRRGLAVWT